MASGLPHARDFRLQHRLVSLLAGAAIEQPVQRRERHDESDESCRDGHGGTAGRPAGVDRSGETTFREWAIGDEVGGPDRR